MTKKIPDNVVLNSEGEYDAALKEYPTSVGAPVIETVDTIAWKNKNLQLVNSSFQARYSELRKTLDTFKESYEYNQILYNAKFSFEPIVGQMYHLYKNKMGEDFISILSPSECNFNFINSFYLNSDKIWVKKSM